MPADPTRLDQQLRFIVELDKLKSVYRRTILTDRSRNENSAEHSWHLAVMAALLAEHSDLPINLPRVIQMLLIHDIVEIDAGDTPAYDPQVTLDKRQRELRAADRLFNLLPPDQAATFRSLWDEFEANETPDARFANALDPLQPLLNNYHTQGQSWRDHHVTAAQVQKRMSPIPAASATLGTYVQSLLTDAITRGYLPAEKRG